MNDRQMKAFGIEFKKIKKIMNNLLGFKVSFEDNDTIKLVDINCDENYLELRVSEN